MPEQWTSIPNWSNYEVSDRGRVRRLAHLSASGRYLSEKMLRVRWHKGMRRVDLCHGSRKKSFFVHKLLAQ